MSTIPQVAEAMQTVLTTVAEEAARESGFVRRQSKLTGAKFVQALVLGWLQRPAATLDALAQMAAALGVAITPQGLDQRFTARAADYLRRVLEAAVMRVVTADPVAIPLLQRFRAVVIDDSTLLALPDALSTVWQGTGERTGHNQAALKLQVRLDLLAGGLTGPFLGDGRAQDKASPLQTTPVPAGALRLADLGFFSLDVLQALHRQGSFFLSRLQVQTAVLAPDGARRDLTAWLARHGPGPVDTPVRIGALHQLPVRLLAAPVPEAVANERRRKLRAAASHKGRRVSAARLRLAGWTILVTNVPRDRLALDEALVLYRARWQIELLFKLWKQHGQIDRSRSGKGWRILCEIYAKLLALVLQHWLLLLGCWSAPNRSLAKAAQTVRGSAALFAGALAGLLDLASALEQLRRCLATGCRMNRRKQAPNTYQLLLNLQEVT